MKLQLTYSQLESLHSLLTGPVFNTHVKGTFDRLGIALLAQVWDKLDKKKAGIRTQKLYKVNLTEAEAIGFFLYWHNAGVPSSMVYEANLIRTINNSIHKQFIN